MRGGRFVLTDIGRIEAGLGGEGRECLYVCTFSLLKASIMSREWFSFWSEDAGALVPTLPFFPLPFLEALPKKAARTHLL